jgi:hypothetical protein
VRIQCAALQILPRSPGAGSVCTLENSSMIRGAYAGWSAARGSIQAAGN